MTLITQCPKCGDNGDKAGDNLRVKDNGFAKCFACGYKIKDFYAERKKEYNPMETYTPLFDTFPEVYIDCVNRKIPKAWCKKYRAIFVKEYLGEPALAFCYYRGSTLVAYHIKPVSKKCKTQGSYDNADMYGSWLHSDPENKLLVITEGHEDCISCAMVGGDAMFHYTSLSNGIGSVEKFITRHYNKLSKYKGIVLCFDNAPDGEEGVTKFIKLYNQIGKIRVAHLPLKDANEMIKAGRGDELKWALVKAEVFKPLSVVTFDDIMKDILEKPKVGRPWPWQSLTDIDHGFYIGKTYIVGSATDTGKCLHPNTPIVMFNGEIKLAKDIKKGDKLLGPDSKERNVLNLGSGNDLMYKIIPKRAETYIVNKEHILTLVAGWDEGEFKKGCIYDISVKDFLQLNKSKQRCLKSWTCSVEFKPTFQEIDPYIYGLWLGDGTKSEFTLTNKDNEILGIWKEYIENKGGFALQRNSVNRCTSITGRYNKKYNPLIQFINSSVIDNQKRIKNEYLRGSREQRLDLLAGLIDSDGYLSNHGTSFEIATKYQGLRDDILYLCRSLGFLSTARERVVKDNVYYRIYITGQIYNIPVILKRKKAKPKSLRYNTSNPQLTSISIEEIGEGDYNGFTLDGDGRFVLGDFQVTHNTTFVKDIVFDFIEKSPEINVGAFFLEHKPKELAHKLLSSKVGYDLEQPDTDWWDKNKILKEAEGLKKHIFMFDPTLGIELKDVVSAIYYFVNVYNVQAIIIDNLTILSESRLIDGKKISEQEYLNEVGKQFNKLKRELNVSFFIICHLAKDNISKQMYLTSSAKNQKKYDAMTSEDMSNIVNKAGLTFESGRMPTIDHLYGGATSAKLANEIFVLARDTTSEDDLIFRTTRVRVLKCKQQKRGSKREFKLIYDFATGRLNDGGVVLDGEFKEI